MILAPFDHYQTNFAWRARYAGSISPYDFTGGGGRGAWRGRRLYASISEPVLSPLATFFCEEDPSCCRGVES